MTDNTMPEQIWAGYPLDKPTFWTIPTTWLGTSYAKYIRADVVQAQLAERDARIAEELGDANERIAQLNGLLAKADARIAELEAAQQWVSVGERLPDDYENVITYVRHPKGPTAIDISGYSVKYGWSYPVKWEYGPLYATHWMPLPPPPVTPVTP
jgi:hypothetical protein